MKYLTLFLTFIAFNLFAQKTDIFQMGSLPTEGVLLDKGWKFYAGDNPDFDDSAWGNIDPTQDVMDLTQIQDGKVKWMRLRIKIDSSILPMQMALHIHQALASQVYINGKEIGHYGTIDGLKTIAKFVYRDI